MRLANKTGRFLVAAPALWGALAVAACLAGDVARAAEPAAAPAPAPAAGAPAGAPAFLRHFTTEHDTLLVINDPLPHLKTLLTDPSLRTLLTEGRLGQALRQGGKAPNTDPAAGWEFIQKNRRWVPAEIAIGIPGTAQKDADALLRATLLVTLCGAAHEAGEGAVKADLPRLQEALLPVLRRLHVPGLRVWARMRDAADAKGVVFLLHEQLKDQEMPAGVKAELKEDRIRVTVTVGEMLADAPARLALLQEAGLVTGEKDPMAKPLGDAVAALGAEMTLEAAGDGVLLTLGPPPGGRPLTGADLGPLFAWGPDAVAYGTWNIGPLVQASAGWLQLWEQWRDTESGKALAESDDQDLLGTLDTLARQLERAAPRGSSQLSAEPGKGLRAVTRESGAAAAGALTGSKLAGMVPATAEAYSLDGSQSVADFGAAVLGDLEGRLATGSLRAELKDKPTAADRKAAAVEQGYYKHFAEFRDLVGKKAGEHFEPPVGWVVGTRGRVQKFELVIHPAAAKGADEPPKPLAFRGKDLPVPEVALVGKARDPAAARAFAARAYGAFVRGVLASAGAEKAEPGEAVKVVDLGLGVPTYSFDLNWIGRAAEASKVKLELTLTGDIEPHFFLVGDYVVFGTSPRLSKEIVAAAAGKAPALPLPPAAGAARLVGCGRVPGAVIGKYMEHLATWLSVFAGPLDEAEGSRTQLKHLVLLLQGLGDLAALVDDVRWTATQEADTRTTEGTVTFK